MKKAAICDQCGTAVPPDCPDGLCSRCLLELAVTADVVEDAPTFPASSASDEEEPAKPEERRIDAYRLVNVLGEGGMGRVFLAEQEHPIRRQVALKVIKRGMDSRQVVSRFEAERQSLAILNHPGIAKVFDAGVTAKGRPYFVMEFVEGVPITDHCDGDRLTIAERLGLFMKVCDAIQHAHQKGVIHRDLKPSNVLVTMLDGEPAPKVIDFGIAKATGDTERIGTALTERGQLVGTPEYMSPEQVDERANDIDTRTDVYSLGVLLYQLLTGVLPFDMGSVREAGLLEMVRIIQEEEPVPPSLRVHSLGDGGVAVAARRGTNRASLGRRLRGDLTWIVHKALEKEPRRRYASASELASDIARHLDDEPISARSPSASYRIRKLAKRHKGPVAAAAAVIVTIVVAGLWSLWQADQMRRQAERMRSSLIVATAADMEDPLLAALLLAEIADQPAPPRGVSVARAVANMPVPSAELVGHENSVIKTAFSPDGELVATGGQNSTARIWRADGSGQPVVMRGHDDDVNSIAFSPDGSRVLTASSDGTARIWRADGSGIPIVLRGHEAIIYSAAFNPDATLVVTGSRDNTARVWSADGTGEPIVLRGHEDWIGFGTSFSPDGSLIATASADGTARLWNADGTGEPVVLRGHEGPVLRIAFSPDGRRVVTTSLADDTARVWRVDGAGEPVVLQHPDDVPDASFNPDGTLVVTACADGIARVWRADGGPRADGRRQPLLLRGHDSTVISAVFSPDGNLVLTGSADGTARVWAHEFDGTTTVVRGPDGVTARLVLRQPGLAVVGAFSPDGRRIVTASDGGVARVWRLDSVEPIILSGHENATFTMTQQPDGTLATASYRPATLDSAAFNADGTRIITAAHPDTTVRIWDADGSGEPIVLRRPRGSMDGAFLSRDGRRVVTHSGNSVVVWPADGSADPVVLRGHEGTVQSSVFSPDGSRVLSASVDGTARVWSVDGSGDPVVLVGHSAEVDSARFSPDGESIVTASRDMTARIWRADGSAAPVVLAGHQDTVSAAVFSPDGTRVATTSNDRTARIWPVDGAGEPIVLRGHESMVSGAAFSPDGRYLLTYSAREGVARVWPADGTGESVVVGRHQGWIRVARFAPGGDRVVTASEHTANVWLSDGTGEPVVLQGHLDTIRDAAFSPDGTRVVTASVDGTARVWRVTWRGLVEYLRDSTTACLGVEDRIRFLAESPADARDRYVACELRHGRVPVE